MSIRLAVVSLVVAAVLTGGGEVAAQQPIETSAHDTSLPIQITADSMEVEQEAQRVTFVGAVDVIQGEMRLKADELVVHYRDREAAEQNQIYRIDVAGNVRLATPKESATGDTGFYDVDAGVIELHGHVVLTSGENVIRGDQARMNLETGQSEVTGGRVEGIFYPEEGNDQ